MDDQLRNVVGFHLLVGQFHFVSHAHHFSSSSVVTIEFDAANYTFTETITTASRPVSVSVQSGFLDRDVVVTVQTMDGTARGGALFHKQKYESRCVKYMFVSTSSSSN